MCVIICNSSPIHFTHFQRPNKLYGGRCVCVCVCVCAHSNWDITRETVGDPANEEVSVAREASQPTESHFPGMGTSL